MKRKPLRRRKKEAVPLANTPMEEEHIQLPSPSHEEPLEEGGGASNVQSRKRSRIELYHTADEAKSSAEEAEKPLVKRCRFHSAIEEEAESSAQRSLGSMKRKREEEAAGTSPNASQCVIPTPKKRATPFRAPFRKPKDSVRRIRPSFTKKRAKKRKPLQRTEHGNQKKPEDAGVIEADKPAPAEDVATPAEDLAAPDGHLEAPLEDVAAPLGPESFIFHKVLGEGGFGKVVLATLRETGRLVALKIVNKRFPISDIPNSVLVERQVLELVGDDPFCTHTYATFQTEDHLFYIMEYLSGGDLSNLFYSKGSCDLETIRLLSAELLGGLQSLHSRGVLHRDIKLGNILLDAAGHVKIADFGLSVIDMFGSKIVTEFSGTPSYMAPEIIRNMAYDTTADYFSLGVVIFKMAFGYHPFSISSDIVKTMHSVNTDIPDFPDNTDPDLKDFLRRLMYKNKRVRKSLLGKIRQHPFFQGIDWEELEAGKTRPPFEMQSSPVIDTTMSINLEDLLKCEENQSELISPQDQMLFNGFSFIRKSWRGTQ